MDSWIATNTVGAAESRGYHNAVWTGTEMIVWGAVVVALVSTLAGDTIPRRTVG